MPDRFFCDEPVRFELPGPGTARLEGGEAHHLLHVLRGGLGDRVTLFDGGGAEYLAEVTDVTRRDVTLAVLAREEVDREAAIDLTIGVAFPKGDRQRVLVEKLTELGVRRLTPLRTERSVVDLKDSALDKLRRAVVEASKQCGRNRLMTIDEPIELRDFLLNNADGLRLFAQPSAATPALAAGEGPVTVAIGPEGGFTDAELAAAVAAGWAPLSLGRSILRIETAAIAAASLYAIGGDRSKDAAKEA